MKENTTKKIYTREDVDKLIISKEIVELPAEYTDEFGNIHNIDEDIAQAERDIELMKSDYKVNFRWNKYEVNRAKRIAAKVGLPYQSFIKSSLKQVMDEYEQKQM
jgi:predicted DNA binding CopG/RHH family protein